MPRQPDLTDLQLILLSTAFAREDGHLFPLKTSVADSSADVVDAISTLLKRKLVMRAPAGSIARTWKTEEDYRIGLVLADRARALIDGEGAAEESPLVEPVAPSAVLAIRPGTKARTVLDLLARAEGASRDDLIDATRWLPHTARAAFTGLRRKGHTIERAPRGNRTVWRLVSGA